MTSRSHDVQNNTPYAYVRNLFSADLVFQNLNILFICMYNLGAAIQNFILFIERVSDKEIFQYCWFYLE